ncbi:MAG: hypothetical protein ACTJGE_02890 [Corynebacterium variabile]|uniref:hypothetical protein n=1 Tax=Corynebacterium variabile TaxID=1727 RepID=UPI003F8F3664
MTSPTAPLTSKDPAVSVLGISPAIVAVARKAARSAGPVSPEAAARVASILNRSTVPATMAAA